MAVSYKLSVFLMSVAGLAGSIRKKGFVERISSLSFSGEMVQIESDIHIAENGPLKEGEVVALGGHELKCQHVIHAVGPMWNGGTSGETEALIKCVENCLISANKLSCKSVALPAISTGNVSLFILTIQGFSSFQKLLVPRLCLTQHLNGYVITLKALVEY